MQGLRDWSTEPVLGAQRRDPKLCLKETGKLLEEKVLSTQRNLRVSAREGQEGADRGRNAPSRVHEGLTPWKAHASERAIIREDHAHHVSGGVRECECVHFLHTPHAMMCW